MPRTIEVVEHDPVWEKAFLQEAGELLKLFGDSTIAIHHIGSTSVPRLMAKPVIDILIVLRETETIDRFSAPMQALGYKVRGECLDAEIPGTPGRFYFSKDDCEKRRTHHVHAYAAGHPEIADKLVFRDYLRVHPQRAEVVEAPPVRIDTRTRVASVVPESYTPGPGPRLKGGEARK